MNVVVSEPVAGTVRGRRARVTSRRVLLADSAARTIITFGGILVILAVLCILTYLVWVVWPLFAPPSIGSPITHHLLPPGDVGKVLFAEVDEYRALGVVGLSTGELLSFDASSGGILERVPLIPPSPAVTAFSRAAHGGGVAFGFADGRIRLGSIRFDVAFIPDADRAPPESGTSGGPDDARAGVMQHLANGAARRVSVSATLDEPLVLSDSPAPVALLDYRGNEETARLAALTTRGELSVVEIGHRKNLLTGATSTEIATNPIPLPDSASAHGPASFLLVTTPGDQLYLAWPDGWAIRYDLRDAGSPLPAETFDLTPEAGVRLTALKFHLGEQSIIATDSEGGTRTWFKLSRPGSNQDGLAMVPAHTLASHRASVSAVAVSSRDKSLVTGADDGSLILHHMTSERTLLTTQLDPPARVTQVQIAPKGDGLFAVTADGRAVLWSLTNPHPEASLTSVFGKVWYEGYEEPAYTWQSSSGTDDFEPKLSLVPLMFGTLKATLCAMLFAVPIALASALYTSEFLDRRVRAAVKPLIEMMASLPSVVLGFLAALVLAPLIETWLVAVLAVFAVAPIAALTTGYLWRLLPRRTSMRAGSRCQGAILVAVLLGSLAAVMRFSGALESMIFGGGIKLWLDGRAGSAASGLAILCWPIVLALLLALDRRYLRGGSVQRRKARSRGAVAVDLGRYLLVLVFSVAIAGIAAQAGARLGLDIRGLLVGTYVQRNALVVGFAMGFAVIPIIYTLAEDALASVPQGLRSASLGCGATAWQTAVRVVVPVAMPGIFSAIMVGLGRAVGETMIVLMAAGNTPLIDLNIFNGLRTLSANIAVELPEAAKNGTLYRVLFLAALLLFISTFAVNTLAEVVRQRFRRKAHQL
ncbi:MAG TPA: ABC transporter permease subunit [Candidatus Polarisedimenticolia bacterium]|nr:ABC transporter permease subunit [Candidatus Polarisedimenticolia bacterium]